MHAIEEMYTIARTRPEGITEDHAYAFIVRLERVAPELHAAVRTAMARYHVIGERTGSDSERTVARDRRRGARPKPLPDLEASGPHP
jgi:hypothetical protein